MEMNGGDDEDECRYSCILVLSAFIQCIIYGISVGYAIQSLQDGSMFQEFDVGEALTTTFFQIFSLCFGLYGVIYLLEKAWKASYGYGNLFDTKLKALFAGLSSIIFLCFAGFFGTYKWPHFKFHGLYFLLNGFTCLFFATVFVRRFQLISEFVHDLLHANNMHWVPISDQNARDLYKLQECDREMRSYINSTRFGPFHRHTRAFRHSEYYQLQKWMAQIERYVCSSEPKQSIMALVREMNERACRLKIDPEDQEHYKQLAALPFILLPMTPVKHGPLEFEDEV